MPEIEHWPYAAAVLRLLQGVVYLDEPQIWSLILSYQTPLQDYFARIGLELLVYEVDGFAYVRQPEPSDDEPSNRKPLPRLTRRIPLTYQLTLLGVLLRERLDQFDSSAQEATAPIVTRDEIVEMLMPFLPQRGDERATHKKIRTWINQTCEIGFLKPTDKEETRFEIRRILKAKFDSVQLQEIRSILEAYRPDEREEDTDDE
ncbi:MAG: DUF4194 domain-containing protein [Phototrophicaceae bacterium]